MLPLHNKTIVLTRAKNQIENSSKLFKDLGAIVIEFPSIEIKETEDWSKFDKLITTKKFDFIIFTSSNSVRFFYQRLKQLNFELDFQSTKVIALGSKTAEMCKEYFINVDFVPSYFSVDGLIKEFEKIDVYNKNILIPQSEIGKKDLSIELEKKNANVFSVVVYKNVLPNPEELKEKIYLIINSEIDAFVFTSPSTFRNFIELMKIQNLKDFFSEKVIAAIGDTTKSEIESTGLEVKIKPDISTIENLAIKLTEYFKLQGAIFDETKK